MRKKYGFTLAEVLIALAIIGIIAAMTIPNLISNFRKAQAETGVKVAFSILSNAIKLAQAEEGSITDMINYCAATESGQAGFTQQANCFANNYLKPYLKYTKSCDIDYQENGNCSNTLYPVVEYKNLDGGYSNWALIQPHYHSSLKLDNGMIIGVLWWNEPGLTFLVDINGSAGPNKTGVDVFFFELNEKQLGCLEKASSTDTKENWCNDSNRIGTACSCLIQQNGWKIPDNYPVKKW